MNEILWPLVALYLVVVVGVGVWSGDIPVAGSGVLVGADSGRVRGGRQSPLRTSPYTM